VFAFHSTAAAAPGQNQGGFVLGTFFAFFCLFCLLCLDPFASIWLLVVKKLIAVPCSSQSARPVQQQHQQLLAAAACCLTPAHNTPIHHQFCGRHIQARLLTRPSPHARLLATDHRPLFRVTRPPSWRHPCPDATMQMIGLACVHIFAESFAAAAAAAGLLALTGAVLLSKLFSSALSILVLLECLCPSSFTPLITPSCVSAPTHLYTLVDARRLLAVTVKCHYKNVTIIKFIIIIITPRLSSTHKHSSQSFLRSVCVSSQFLYPFVGRRIAQCKLARRCRRSNGNVYGIRWPWGVGENVLVARPAGGGWGARWPRWEGVACARSI